MFLDETKGVTNKARKASKTSRTSSSSSTPSLNPWSPPDLHKSLSAGDEPRSLTPNLEAQASAFFFEHFAIDETLSIQYQMYASSISDPSSALQALTYSIRALGLAGLARSTGAAHIVRLAGSQYLEAIRAMNSALQDPEMAKQDDTLLAVMILTAFETIANTDAQNTLAAWSNHAKGAAALLAARGTEQFQTEEGVRMFVQAALPCIVNNISQGAPLDPTIKRLYQEASLYADLSNPAWKLFEWELLFADFFGQVKSKIIVDPHTIIRQAWELEELGARYMSRVEDPWTFQTIQSTDDNELVPLGYYHVYSYFYIAEMHNGIRSQRLLLNQMIRSILLVSFATRPPIFTDQSYTTMLQRATDNLLTLQQDVIASVPQYLGYHSTQTTTLDKGKAPATPTQTPSSTPPKPLFLWSHFPQRRYILPTTAPLGASGPPGSSRLTSLPVIRAGGGATLPWVLFTLGTTDVCTPKVRAWCVERLRAIGVEMGVQQALLFAGKLEGGSYVENFAWYRSFWEGVLVVSEAGAAERGEGSGLDLSGHLYGLKLGRHGV